MRKFRHWREASLVAFIALVYMLAKVLDPAFLEPNVQLQIAGSAWELALLAVPMTLIVLTGGIDLSVGATVSLCAVAIGMGFEASLPIPACVMCGLLTGSSPGLLNGLFVTKVGVHPLIVTLATMSVYFGLAQGISHARSISGFPVDFAPVFGSLIGPLPVSGWIVLVSAVAAVACLRRTVAGQSLYAVGLNETASRFSGLKVDRVKCATYVLSGFAAGLVAVFYTARRNTANAEVGQGLELNVITAVVLGGTSIFGGRGGLIGTLLGVLLVHETRQFVRWHWEKDEWNLIVIGSVLVLSVLVNTLFRKRDERSE